MDYGVSGVLKQIVDNSTSSMKMCVTLIGLSFKTLVILEAASISSSWNLIGINVGGENP